VQNFCGQTSLTDLAALFYQTDLLITVDTGATHIAATTGVPMVTMYGCTSPKRWHPCNENARVLTTDEPCCPCKIAPEECPSWPQPKCLWGVTPAMVLEQCEELLQ
jgi:ADP-heptose:LPS heptosyltransferase